MTEDSGGVTSLPPQGAGPWCFNRKGQSKNAEVQRLCGWAPMSSSSGWANVGKAWRKDLSLRSEETCVFVGLGPHEAVGRIEAEELCRPKSQAFV